MKGLSRTKMGIRVRTMKSMKSQKARPPTFLRAISFTCRLSRYHWFPRERSKQTSTTFRAARTRRRVRRWRRNEKGSQSNTSSLPPRTQIRCLAGGLSQPLPAQILARVAWRGAVSRRRVQHEVLGAGGGDDARRQEDVDDSLEEQEDLGLLQVGAVCKTQVIAIHTC